MSTEKNETIYTNEQLNNSNPMSSLQQQTTNIETNEIQTNNDINRSDSTNIESPPVVETGQPIESTISNNNEIITEPVQQSIIIDQYNSTDQINQQQTTPTNQVNNETNNKIIEPISLNNETSNVNSNLNVQLNNEVIDSNNSNTIVNSSNPLINDSPMTYSRRGTIDRRISIGTPLSPTSPRVSSPYTYDADDIPKKHEKALKSDVDTEFSISLLLEIQKNDKTYSDFDKEDLTLLSEVLSVLNLDAGEKIIAKDEEATFCGIVLQGTFQAIVNPTLTVDLNQGALVGKIKF
jgi:hypothetical protein